MANTTYVGSCSIINDSADASRQIIKGYALAEKEAEAAARGKGKNLKKLFKGLSETGRAMRMLSGSGSSETGSTGEAYADPPVTVTVQNDTGHVFFPVGFKRTENDHHNALSQFWGIAGPYEASELVTGGTNRGGFTLKFIVAHGKTGKSVQVELEVTKTSSRFYYVSKISTDQYGDCSSDGSLAIDDRSHTCLIKMRPSDSATYPELGIVFMAQKNDFNLTLQPIA